MNSLGTNAPDTWQRALTGKIQEPPPHSRTKDNREDSLEALLDAFARAHGLSHRERSVVTMAANAVHDKEIAARLGCSLKTVEVFWRRIYAKTGRRGHTAVVAGILHFSFGLESAPIPTR